MERNFAAITIFTLLFAVSTARISLDPKPTEAYLPKCATESLPEDSSKLVVLPTEKTESRLDEPGQISDKDTDKMFRVNLTPRSDFARFHAINRRFSDHRHFQNPFVKPRPEASHGNKITLNTESSKPEARNIHRHGGYSRLKSKHEYEHLHHHQHKHQHHRNHNHHNKDNASMPKHKFVRENTKSNVLHQKKFTKEHEASSFMRSFRKFLKHTFD